jgi:iron complex outermembrane receptor protein
VNGAAYYTQVTNRQVYIFDQATASQIIASPIPHADIEGIEAEIEARPVAGWDVQLSGGFQNSNIASYDPTVFAGTAVTGNFTGNRLPEVPRFTYAFATQYAIPLGDEAVLTPRLEVNGSGGKYYWDIDNTTARSFVNLINFRLAGQYGRYSLTGFVENLTDKKYIIDFEEQRFSGSPFGDYNQQSAGRRFGFLFKAEF